MDPNLKAILEKVLNEYGDGRKKLLGSPKNDPFYEFIHDCCMGTKEATEVNEHAYEQSLQILRSLKKFDCRGWVQHGHYLKQPQCCRLYLNLLDTGSVETICSLTVDKISKIDGFHSVKLPEDSRDFDERSDNCVFYFTTVEARNRTIQVIRKRQSKLTAGPPPPLTALDPGDSDGSETHVVVLGLGTEPTFDVDWGASRPYSPALVEKKTSLNKLRANLIYLSLLHTQQVYHGKDYKKYPCAASLQETFFDFIRLYFGKCNIPLTAPSEGGDSLLFTKADSHNLT